MDPEFWQKLGEHAVLSAGATGAAVLVGVPLGVLAATRRAWRGPVLGAAGVLQTVPSLALLTLLMAATGRIGFVPALGALVTYALLPVVENTVAGLEAVPTATLDAARGLGMTEAQVLWQVRLPLARGVVVAGVRTAAVATVGTATLTAFVGAGGLGDFIYRGLSSGNPSLLLLGALPAAALALGVDLGLAVLERRMDPRGGRAA